MNNNTDETHNWTQFAAEVKRLTKRIEELSVQSAQDNIRTQAYQRQEAEAPQLTAEQAAVLEFVLMEDNGDYIPCITTCCPYAEAHQNEINDLVENELLNNSGVDRQNGLSYWQITAVGRAALEHYQQAETVVAAEEKAEADRLFQELLNRRTAQQAKVEADIEFARFIFQQGVTFRAKFPDNRRGWESTIRHAVIQWQAQGNIMTKTYTVEALFDTEKRSPNNRYRSFVIGVYDSWQKAEDAISDSISNALGDYEELDTVSVDDDIEMTFYKYALLNDVYYKGFRIRQLTLGKGFQL